MSMFNDEIKKHREKFDLQDGRLKQLLLEEGVHRDTLADDRKSDVWPAAREKLDSIQSEIPREQAALHQAQQDLERLHAARDAVDRAVGSLPSDARPANLEEAREIADRVHRDGQASEVARSKMLRQQHEWHLEAAKHLQHEFQSYMARPDVQAVLQSSVNEGQELQTELRNPDVAPPGLQRTDMDAAIGGVDVLLQVAIGRRVLQQRNSDREERALLTQGNALAAHQAGDLEAMKHVIAKDWEGGPKERAAKLAEYGLTPDAPGDYYKNLFDHQVQRLNQDLRLDQQNWAQLGLQTSDGGNPAKAVWVQNGVSHSVCFHYARREVGVDAVEKPLAQYERVLQERGVEDIAERLASHRLTLEEAAEPTIASRAQDLHAQYFSELEGGAASPSGELTERSDRGLDPASSELDLPARKGPELER